MSHDQISRVSLLGCRFDILTKDEVLNWCKACLQEPTTRVITTVNVAILMMMRTDPHLRSIIEESDLTVADGLPIIWLSMRLKRLLPERVTGVDLCDDLAGLAAEEGARLFLLGATDDVIKATRTELQCRHPSLTFSGVRDGYFDMEKGHEIAQDIADRETDILLIGMGAPRQEVFINRFGSDTGAKIILPVGGSFDVLAGARKRAPLWMQRYGFEWSFRLAQEPRRLFWRYAVTNTQFLFLSIKEIIKTRISRQ